MKKLKSITLVTAIIVIIISCDQKKAFDNINTKPFLSKQQISDSNSKIKKIYEDFTSYKKLEFFFKNGQDPQEIPKDIIRKTVKLNDTLFNNVNVGYIGGYIGEFIRYYKHYNFIYIRHGNCDINRDLYITFNKYGQQVDIKMFVTQCWGCKKNYIASYAWFSEIDTVLSAKYYKASPLDRSMPYCERKKILKEEKWSIDTNGYFIQK